jgi:ribulose-bisphosphate carboxylase large chain
MEERFQVVYHILGDEQEVRERARGICLEQTVEVDDALVPPGFIREQVVGRVEAVRPLRQGTGPAGAATISYSLDTTAFELTQLLNVVFGNTSLKSGIRVASLSLPPSLRERFRGPRFGVEGLRRLLGVAARPLLCTALKPMGTGPAGLADMAARFARGGIDVIKDDHGLTDQPFCRFRDRVRACVEAVRRANATTGTGAIYVPNVTAPAAELLERARFARECGAGGLLVAPGLVGFDSMRMLAEDDALGLPIFSHPALLGSMVVSAENGVDHGVLFGHLQRLAGADASIYPNWGGRFGFSREECVDIAQACREALPGMAPIFPAPGGGMTLERVSEMLECYGSDVLFLVGGALYGRSSDLEDNARHFRSMVEP